MAKLTHYALDFDAIEPTLDEYFTTQPGYTHEFSQVNDFTYKLSVSDGICKKPGVLMIYNRQGLYCMDVVGTPHLAPVCRSCSEFIKERLQIPSAERQTFTVRGVDPDIAELCLQYLDANYVLSSDKKDVPDARHFLVSDSYRSSVSVICYENGTIYVQGAYTALFLRVVTDITKAAEVAPEATVSELLRIAPLVRQRYPIDVDALVTRPQPLKNNHLDVMLLSSVILANSAVALGDYGAYSFGVLKAIEGLLSLKLISHLSSDSASFGKCFSPDARNVQRLSVHDFDAPEQSALKSAIEDSYNFYNNNRHSTFHVKKLAVAASRILTQEEALDMIDDGLKLINQLCDNW